MSSPTQGHPNAHQALIYWANAAVNNNEWIKWEWRRRDGSGNWNMSVQEPNFNNVDLEYRRIEP